MKSVGTPYTCDVICPRCRSGHAHPSAAQAQQPSHAAPAGQRGRRNSATTVSWPYRITPWPIGRCPSPLAQAKRKKSKPLARPCSRPASPKAGASAMPSRLQSPRARSALAPTKYAAIGPARSDNTMSWQPSSRTRSTQCDRHQPYASGTQCSSARSLRRSWHKPCTPPPHCPPPHTDHECNHDLHSRND